MPKRISARLRPHAQSVRLAPHPYAVRQLSRPRVENVDFFVVATRHPQLLPVGGHVPHIRAAPARHRPGRDDLLVPRIEHGDGARAAAPAPRDRKSTRLNSSHEWISYAVFCLKKKRI